MTTANRSSMRVPVLAPLGATDTEITSAVNAALHDEHIIPTGRSLRDVAQDSILDSRRVSSGRNLVELDVDLLPSEAPNCRIAPTGALAVA